MFRTSLALCLVALPWITSAPSAQCEVFEVLPTAVPGAGGAFGDAVALSGDRALLGAPLQATLPGGAGGAYVFEKTPVVGWVGGAPLLPADIQPGDEVGAAVALAGDIAVVANPADDDLGADAGAVYVFEFAGGSWSETAKLFAGDAQPGARFGAAVALEGARLVVGAPHASGAVGGGGFSTSDVGAAYAFERVSAGVWLQTAKLVDPAGATGDRAGSAVALSGPNILVGAPGQSGLGPTAGAAYVYTELGLGTFAPPVTLTASDGTPADDFGAAVGIDDGVIVIGAPADSDVCAGCGSVYVYKSVGPGLWTELLKVGEGSVVDGELLGGDGLGTAVAVSGNTVAIGAPGNVDLGVASGSVYVYKAGLSGFVKTNKLNACDAAGFDSFGTSLAMDSGTLLIGAPGVDDVAADGGSAYFFSPNVIEVKSPELGLYFSEPDLQAAIPMASPPGNQDPACDEAPLFPRIELEDLFDNNPQFVGHRFVHSGRIWELYLVEHPISSAFTYDGYDITVGDEIFSAIGSDCDPEVEFDIEYGYQDPVSGETGILTTFLWTECNATNGSSTLGPFEVTLRAFVPQGGGQARFALGAEVSSTTPDWAFWAGRLNLALVEKHPDPPQELHYELLTPFGHLVEDPALNIIADPAQGLPPRADALGRPSNQVLGFYDDQGRGLYAAMADVTGNRAKNFQFYGCPGDANTHPTINISSISYQTEVVPAVPFEAVPSSIGRFRGDWYDLTSLYRLWMSNSAKFTVKGLVKDRTDVPDWVKQMEMVAVLSPGAAYVPILPPSGSLSPRATSPSGSAVGGPLALGSARRGAGPALPDRLQEYMDHWALDRMVTTQFGTEWAGGCAGVGDYDVLSAFMPTAFAMEAKEQELAALGKDFKYMVYMLDTFYATAGTELDWSSLVTRQPGGNALVWTPAVECGGGDIALIDPSTIEWQDHLYAVAETLGAMGVDGVYADNAFPILTEYDFSSDHGHAPGFGPYMTAGFGDMFEALRDGGGSGSPGQSADFVTYTEFFFEGFISQSGTYGPEQAWTDWVTADDATVQVPLISTLYHHYTVLGPPFVGYYTHDLPPYDYDNNVLNLTSASERAKGRAGANFTMAWGWVNGCSIWSPDPGLALPLQKKYSFELDEAESNLPPGTFDELRAVCAFGADLARTRGQALIAPYLTTGRRLRSFELTTTPSSVPVVLQEIYNPYTAQLLGPETEDFPPILNGTWRDLTTNSVGIALANFTDQFATGSFTLDPASFGFTQPVTVYLVGPGGETPYVGPFTGPQAIDVSMNGETTLFLRVHE